MEQLIMNIKKIATNLDYNKLLTFIVAVAIIIYLIITVIKNYDFSTFKQKMNTAKKDFVNIEIIEYLNSRADYYYPIEGQGYCISKEELVNSNMLSKSSIDSINTNYVYALYETGSFNLAFISECLDS